MADITLWEWPSFTSNDFFALILLILLGVLLWLFLGLRANRQKDRDRSWLQLLLKAYANDLPPAQVEVLRVFFSTLKHREALKVKKDLSFFRETLFDFLKEQEDMNPEVRVQLLDRFFMKDDHKKQSVHELRDIQPGELCSMSFQNNHFLGTVIETREQDILFHIPDWLPGGNTVGKEITIYIFRPEVAGFQLKGKILRTGKESLYFRHSGSIEMRSYHHLMVFSKIQFELHSWPVVYSRKEGEEEENGDLRIPLASKNFTIYGRTERVSDRAFSFHFASEEDRVFFRTHQDITWEVKLILDDDKEFVCRGRIMPPGRPAEYQKADYSYYIFKFIDADESERKELFDWIKSRNPIREELYYSDDFKGVE